MISITRLGGQEMWVNADLIELVETTPDTIITLTTGKKVLVRETPEQICARVLRYRRAARTRRTFGTRQKRLRAQQSDISAAHTPGKEG